MGGKELDRDQLSFYCWIVCVVTVLSMAALVSWVSLTPKNPRFGFSVEHLVGSNDRLGHHGNASLPNDSLIINLEVSNPNKRMGIYYSGIMLELVKIGNYDVGRNSTPGFYQGYKNVTMFQVPIHGVREIWQGMNFMIRVETDVRFRIMKWKTKHHHIVYQEQLSNEKMNALNGALSGRNNTELQNERQVRIGN